MTVKTIVVCMLENRSFDHLLGWLSLPPYGQRKDIDGLVGGIDNKTRELTNIDYENPAGGYLYRPHILEGDEVLSSDLPHGRQLIRDQMHPAPHGNGYLMDGFAEAYTNAYQAREDHPESMKIFPPNLIPATSFLARAYMVCDHWFCPIPTDTHPNRLMALGGITQIDTTGGRPPTHNDLVIDWCDARQIKWRVYSNGFPFLAIVRPKTYLGRGANFRNFDDLARDFQSEPDGDFPQVIFVDPDFIDDPFVRYPNCNHPPLPMGPGEAFLADVYRAVTSNKKRWGETVLLVVYDEHGGFYDHVPPFAVTTNPPPKHEWKDPAAFTSSGPRVPAMIVSPLVKAASASKKRFDHTAILQFIADVFDGGKPYSAEVARRHKEGKIERIQSVLGSAARKDVPFMPPLPPFRSVTYSGKRPATTPGMQAFEHARAQMHESDPKGLVAKLPEVAFHVPVTASAAKPKPKPKPKPKAPK